MKKPNIVCHMMTSIDGRIDCEMVGQLTGVQEYYSTLEELNLPSTLSGRVTAQLELAMPGYFKLGKASYSGKRDFPKRLKRMAMRSSWIRRERCYGKMIKKQKNHM